MRTIILVIVVLIATIANAQNKSEVSSNKVDTVFVEKVVEKSVYFSNFSKHGDFGGDAYWKYSTKTTEDGHKVIIGQKVNQAGWAFSGAAGYEFNQGPTALVEARWRLKHVVEFRGGIGIGQKQISYMSDDVEKNAKFTSSSLMLGAEFNFAKRSPIDPYIGAKVGFQYFTKVTDFKTPEGKPAEWKSFCLSGEGFAGVKFGGPKTKWKPFVEVYTMVGDPNEKSGLYNTVNYGVRAGVIFNLY